MTIGGESSQRGDVFFVENWPETTTQRIFALRNRLTNMEKTYERLVKAGGCASRRQAHKLLANLDYNRRIVPMCMNALCRQLQKRHEVDIIDYILQLLEQNPTQQLPQYLFTVVTKINASRE